jgi:hypothetical protein
MLDQAFDPETAITTGRINCYFKGRVPRSISGLVEDFGSPCDPTRKELSKIIPPPQDDKLGEFECSELVNAGFQISV